MVYDAHKKKFQHYDSCVPSNHSHACQMSKSVEPFLRGKVFFAGSMKNYMKYMPTFPILDFYQLEHVAIRLKTQKTTGIKVI